MWTRFSGRSPWLVLVGVGGEKRRCCLEGPTYRISQLLVISFVLLNFTYRSVPYTNRHDSRNASKVASAGAMRGIR